MSRASDLLNQIQSNGAAEIHKMIETGHVEDLFIDYKISNTSLPGRSLDRFDKKNLAKALSGFGNSDGGLIIWGVACRSTENGDIPSGPRLVDDAVAFKTLLDNDLGGLTLPQSTRAENFAFVDEGGPNGFVVTYIPPGFDIPYHSNHPEARGYYLRAGSAFHQVPPGLLAGMFGRRPNPELDLTVFPEFEFSPGAGFAKIIFNIRVSNKGRGVGRGLYIKVDAADTEHTNYYLNADPALWTNLPTADDRWVIMDSGSKVPLPPGVQINTTTVTLRWRYHMEQDAKIGISVGIEGGSGDQQTIEIYSATLRSIGDILCENPQRHELQQELSKVAYTHLDVEQRVRQKTMFSIPSHFMNTR